MSTEKQMLQFAIQRCSALEQRVRELEEDAARLQFLEDETHKGMAPNLVFDDDGNWAVSYAGAQPMPEGDGRGFSEPVQIGVFVEPHEWRPSIRAAIDSARGVGGEGHG